MGLKKHAFEKQFWGDVETRKSRLTFFFFCIILREEIIAPSVKITSLRKNPQMFSVSCFLQV